MLEINIHYLYIHYTCIYAYILRAQYIDFKMPFRWNQIEDVELDINHTSQLYLVLLKRQDIIVKNSSFVHCIFKEQ